MACFVVTMVHGPAWDDARGIRDQAGWTEHAAFMDALVEQGFVLLGGPLDGGRRALLVVDADGVEAVRARLADDPWASTGILETGSCESWTIWLDGRATTARP